MSPTPFQIEPFTPELLPQVAELLRHLWSEDGEANQRIFRWKYHDNPYRASTAGVVALHAGRVVGWRGYFPTAWTAAGSSEPVRILCPGDTCVEPAWRQHGLSLAMAELASQRFAGEASLLLNTTATFASLPGYRKLGFLPLAPKAYCSAYGLLGLGRYILAYARRPQTTPIREHATAGFVVTTQPRPDEMAALAGRAGSLPAGLAPARSAEYLRWRFRRPGAAYAFYYAYANGALAAYIVCGLSPNRRRGYLLDWLDGDGRALGGLVERMLGRGDLDIVSIAAASLAATALDWRGLGFRSAGLLRRLERRRTGELPLLVRPVAQSCTGRDWVVGGVDVREPGNWCYRELVSDAF